MSFKQQAFTLLEMLLAMAVSSILVVGLVHLLLLSKAEIAEQNATLDALDQMRFVNYFMQQVVRNAFHIKVLNNQLILDQLITINRDQQRMLVKYYLTKSSKNQWGLFQKPLGSRRLGLVQGMISMHVYKYQHGVLLWFLLQSNTLLKLKKQSYYFDEHWVSKISHHRYMAWPLYIAIKEKK